MECCPDESFKNTGAFALGTLLLPACNSQENKVQSNENAAAQPENTSFAGSNLALIGLQLYSVKELIEKDLKSTLQQLADIEGIKK